MGMASGLLMAAGGSSLQPMRSSGAGHPLWVSPQAHIPDGKRMSTHYCGDLWRLSVRLESVVWVGVRTPLYPQAGECSLLPKAHLKVS